LGVVIMHEILKFLSIAAFLLIALPLVAVLAINLFYRHFFGDFDD
jgi:hypothetical protein